MPDTSDIKKTIHFFDKDNAISSHIRKIYQSRYRILRKEQYYSLIIIEGLKSIGAPEFGELSLGDIMDILDRPFDGKHSPKV